MNAGLVLPLLRADVEGEAAGAHPPGGGVGAGVAAFGGVPLGGPGAAAGAALALAQQVPYGLVPVVLRPAAVPAEEPAVRDPVVVAGGEFELKLRVGV
jgi:hypothetical protein